MKPKNGAAAPRRPMTLGQRFEEFGLRGLSGLFGLLPHGAAVHAGDFLGRIVSFSERIALVYDALPRVAVSQRRGAG